MDESIAPETQAQVAVAERPHTEVDAPPPGHMKTKQKAQFCYLGPLRIPTGYAQAAREHLKALVRSGLPICGKDTSTSLSFFLRKELVLDDHEMNEAADNRPEYAGPFEGFILHTTPDTLRHMGKPTGAYVVWECDGLPTGWAAKANEMDFLFTCSDFSKNLFVKGGVTKPIYVVPHPIDITLFNPDVPAITPQQWAVGHPKHSLVEMERPDTIFLTVSQWMPRKGIEDLLTAYLTEFTADDRVGLLIMAWGGSHGILERERLKQRIREVRSGLNIPRDMPPIWFIGEGVPRTGIPQIYAACDVFVSASRGEAMGIPYFEAAATGKPSISAGWGGQWDFFDDDSAYRVEYDLEPPTNVGGMWKHYSGTQLWARPRLMSLRAQMRRAHEERSERVKIGQRALEVVLDRLTHDRIGEEMKNIFINHVETRVNI